MLPAKEERKSYYAYAERGYADLVACAVVEPVSSEYREDYAECGAEKKTAFCWLECVRGSALRGCRRESPPKEIGSDSQQVTEDKDRKRSQWAWHT